MYRTLLMNKENIFLSLIAATTASIVMILSLHWAGPVAMFGAGVTVFGVVLHITWKEAGASALPWARVSDFINLWLWLALVLWFAVIATSVWIGLGFLAMALFMVTVLWYQVKHGCKA
jgi:hypothetical protein